MLKALLEQCPPEKKGALERFLPEKQRLHLAQLPLVHFPIEPDLFTPQALLEKVHWSWFLPTLKTYSEDEQKLFLAALKPLFAKNLAKTLDLLQRNEEISKPAKHYLRQVLLDSLIDRENPPIAAEYLPDSPLKKLLKRSKKELVKLIDLLSLHDLAEELRQIVETKMLKKIYSFLSEEEKKVLKAAGNYKEALTTGRIGLDRWDGSEESFRTLLHRRGLARFAIALSGQSADFLWHICHQLDIGRGSTLYKLCAKETSLTMREIVTRQVEELL